MGFVSDVGSLHADADIFVAPSVTESFGMSAIEAAMARVPMVLGRIKPWTDYFKGGADDCVFVDHSDDESIAQGILQLLKDRKAAREMGLRGYDTASKQFSATTTLEALNKIDSYLGRR